MVWAESFLMAGSPLRAQRTAPFTAFACWSVSRCGLSALTGFGSAAAKVPSAKTLFPRRNFSSTTKSDFQPFSSKTTRHPQRSPDKQSRPAPSLLTTTTSSSEEAIQRVCTCTAASFCFCRCSCPELHCVKGCFIETSLSSGFIQVLSNWFASLIFLSDFSLWFFWIITLPSSNSVKTLNGPNFVIWKAF